ncbi:uncharacterized protein LOC126880821 [Diabrotica virgifera virgifera]|uniref:Peptidase aspartic putative domain-containing protein n=1 Tax=Diabrotica virgifera virgifera TaxID=50390 RepID=A0ABM5JSC4_DIAVI|nr:uncharacterized protein LOC126880821 [Diabrotica virgifera virgifera]
MESIEEKNKVMKKKSKLGHIKGEKIFISQDMTVLERNIQKEIGAKCKELRDMGRNVKRDYNGLTVDGNEKWRWRKDGKTTDRLCPESEPSTSKEHQVNDDDTEHVADIQAFRSPEQIRGYPKAQDRKLTRKETKRGRSMISSTDTPENHTSIINNVLSVPDSDTGDEEKVRELFLDLFYKIKVLNAEFFGSPSESPGPASCASGEAHQSHLRLPRIDLPRFQGNFINFASFVDLYNSIVHNNAALGNVEKFKYLKCCLDGTPLSLIRNLPITNDNYQVAYDLIVKRYTNVRRCATAHWDAIMGVQKISAVNSKNVAKLVDTFLENLAALKTLGLPTEHWDFIMFNLLLSKLDVDSIKLFELENKSNEISSFKKLVAFIETQYIAYDNLDSSINEGKKSSQVPNNTEPRANSQHQVNDSRRNRSSSSFVTNSSSVCCALCKQSHYLNQCSLFLDKSPKERYQFCKESSSCFKCLNQANHSVKSCPTSFKCSKCSSHLHNSLLHFDRNRSNSQSSSENNSPGSSGIESSTEVSHCAASFVGKKNETKKEILLGTVLVHAIDSKGCKQPLRCLLDSGSMSSFISRKAANRLGWPKTPCSFEINGLDSMQTKLNQGQISFSIQPRHQESPVFHLKAIITDRVCSDLPSTQNRYFCLELY